MNERFIRLHIWCCTLLATSVDDNADGDDDDLGQATTEYALVMLGAAAVALLVITWATAGGGAGRIGRLFDKVIDEVVSRI